MAVPKRQLIMDGLKNNVGTVRNAAVNKWKQWFPKKDEQQTAPENTGAQLDQQQQGGPIGAPMIGTGQTMETVNPANQGAPVQLDQQQLGAPVQPVAPVQQLGAPVQPGAPGAPGVPKNTESYHDVLLNKSHHLDITCLKNIKDAFGISDQNKAVAIIDLIDKKFEKAAGGRAAAAMNDDKTKWIYANAGSDLELVGVRGSDLMDAAGTEPVFYSKDRGFFNIETNYFQGNWWVNALPLYECGATIDATGEAVPIQVVRQRDFAGETGTNPPVKVHTFGWSGDGQAMDAATSATATAREATANALTGVATAIRPATAGGKRKSKKAQKKKAKGKTCKGGKKNKSKKQKKCNGGKKSQRRQRK